MALGIIVQDIHLLHRFVSNITLKFYYKRFYNQIAFSYIKKYYKYVHKTLELLGTYS